jgi:Protein of unknown function (DUF3383)
MTQPLSVVAPVNVFVSGGTAATPTFNQGLIVGPSTRIPTATRIMQFNSLAALLIASGSFTGFQTTDPEYIAAQLYFAQTPTPATLWVGRQDLTVPETPLQALTACRTANSNWWGCYVTSAVTADHEAIAAQAQSWTPASMYFYTTSDAAVLNDTSGNVFETLAAASYNRAFGVYSTTQSGGAPNNAYAGAAALGVCMGLNTGGANSNFTMKFKALVGVAAEPLTATQIGTIEIPSNGQTPSDSETASNGNVYINYGNTYNWLEQGVVANGQYLDEVLGIDMLAADIQNSLAALLTSVPSVPRTNAGEMQLIAAVNAACDRAVARGFIAPGTWSGQTVLDVAAGTVMPKGYVTQAQSFALQSSDARAARQAMPIYVTLIAAGSMHSITVNVYVQQ